MAKRGSNKPPKERVEYLEAIEVEEMSRELIEKNHGHLCEASIKFLFRTGKWESKGQTIYGHSEKVSAKWKSMADYDFVIVMNRSAWMNSASRPELQEAILDHELTHCTRGDDDKLGNPVWFIQPHTIEDFTSVIRRHGAWHGDLQNFFKAMGEYNQVTLFDEKKKVEKKEKTGTEG